MKKRRNSPAHGTRIFARSLRVFARLLPALSQIVVLVIAFLQHNLLFAAMAATGALMMVSLPLSEWLAARANSSPAAPKTTRHRPAAHHQPTYRDDSDAMTHAMLARGRSLPACDLTTLLARSDSAISGSMNGTPAANDLLSHSDSPYSADTRIPASDMWKHCVRWWVSERRSADLAAPVGMLADSQRIWAVDIVRNGPHALVAGTTGSGKSVLLQAWCASLALQYSPARLHFVFLDFKGGATFASLKNLPHTVGCVSDLDIQHARRALRAIDAELQRREELLAAHHAACITDLPDSPPRLMIVIDEFQMLRFALPDYIERLARITAQGRSLGMHLILATQNPLKSVSPDMKANLNLLICLRVKDRAQSADLLGTAAAARIPQNCPGLALVSDGDGLECFRSAIFSPKSAEVACCGARRFLSAVEPHSSASLSPPPLFTAPLPQSIYAANYPHPAESSRLCVAIGLEDDGVAAHLCMLNLSHGNVAIIGGQRCGKSTAIATIRTAAGSAAESSGTPPAAYPAPNYAIHYADDADALLDPFATDSRSTAFRADILAKDICVVFSARSMKDVRHPELCSARIIFPSGDSSVDLLNGIPRAALDDWEPTDYQIPGRAVLIAGACVKTIQLFTP